MPVCSPETENDMTEPRPVQRGDRADRADRYQEIGGILMDERLYELLSPGTFDRLLEKLQDAVPAVPYEDIATRIEEELGGSPEDVFATFERKPLAAASIGQVHRATLPDGRRVVVKVQRLGVTEQMAVDLDIMERQSRAAGKHLGIARGLDVPGIATHFLGALRSELDGVPGTHHPVDRPRFQPVQARQPEHQREGHVGRRSSRRHLHRDYRDTVDPWRTRQLHRGPRLTLHRP